MTEYDYGLSDRLRYGIVDERTVNMVGFYELLWEAEEALTELNDPDFHIVEFRDGRAYSLPEGDA